MTPCARPTQPCQVTPFSSALRLDVEVLADRYEDLLALYRDKSLESEPQEEAEEIEEEAADDLPF